MEHELDGAIGVKTKDGDFVALVSPEGITVAIPRPDLAGIAYETVVSLGRKEIKSLMTVSNALRDEALPAPAAFIAALLSSKPKHLFLSGIAIGFALNSCLWALMAKLGWIG